MRNVAVVIACVALLVACDPGEPDIDYGVGSTAELPFGISIGPDGSV